MILGYNYNIAKIISTVKLKQKNIKGEWRIKPVCNELSFIIINMCFCIKVNRKYYVKPWKMVEWHLKHWKKQQ